MKSRIYVDEEDEENIPTESHCEDPNHCREEDEISLAMGEDAQEDEPIYRGLVQPYSHGLVAVT
jgi:hypothetical protein